MFSEGTEFSEIYDDFLNKVESFQLNMLSDEELDTQLLQYLKSANRKSKQVLKNITCDYDMETYSCVLDEEVIDIISNWMIYAYMTPKIMTEKLLEQQLKGKDYQLYSQANHVDSMRNLYKDIRNETRTMMTRYSYTSRIGGANK